jgi:hypothetical protein
MTKELIGVLWIALLAEIQIGTQSAVPDRAAMLRSVVPDVIDGQELLRRFATTGALTTVSREDGSP